MNKLEKSRERATNWTLEMKEALREFVSAEISIIDSRSNSTALISAKYKAWESIKSKMDALGYCQPIKKLKEQWNRVKVYARKNISDYKRHQNETGGGPPPTEPTEMDYMIKEMAPLDFELDYAEFDSDSRAIIDKENVAVSSKEVETEKKQIEAEKENMKNTTNVSEIRSKKRKNACPGTTEEMIKKRSKQIEGEMELNTKLLNLKYEIEVLKFKNLKEIHDKDLEIRNKEIELLCLKIDKETVKFD